MTPDVSISVYPHQISNEYIYCVAKHHYQASPCTWTYSNAQYDYIRYLPMSIYLSTHEEVSNVLL